MDGSYSQGYDYDVWGNVTHKFGWGGEVQGGSAGQSSDIYYAYTNNRRNGFSYDAAGNLTNDLGQTFTYDVTGQQTNASYTGYSLVQSYDGDGLRVKKNDNGTTTYYLRSSVLAGQVVAEMDSGGALVRDYVYLGGQLLALRVRWGRGYSLYWVHEDPVTKSKRVTDIAGAIVSTLELDPWGADTPRSNNAAFQPKKYTSYDRDGNASDEAMFRRYNRWHSRFDQPDPYDGSYDLNNPQSFNRYAYVQGDPVNFVDPTGLDTCYTSTGRPFPCSPEDRRVLAGAQIVVTNTMSSLFGNYFLPASQGGHSPMFFGLMGAPATEGIPDGPQKPAPSPTPLPPCNVTGSGDIGGELITPVFVGPKGGVQLDAKGAYPYFGLAGGTPGKGVSINVNTRPVTPGLQIGASGGFIIGVSYSANIAWSTSSFRSFGRQLINGTWSFGGTTPGASANVTVVLAPKFLQKNCR